MQVERDALKVKEFTGKPKINPNSRKIVENKFIKNSWQTSNLTEI
jgi:hypothetical protein